MKPIEKHTKMKPLSVFTTHSKSKTQREVTSLHLGHHLLSGFTASDVYMCFHSVGKKRSVY